MRKITALIALALAALLLASACGGGGQPAGTPTPASPAAGKIAFVSYRDGNLGIYVMNADGSGQTRLSENKSGPHGDFAPAWSPDGSRIAFMSDRDGRSNYEIYVMNADGTGQTNLTDNPDIDSNPSWSPDGSRIAFDSGRDSYEIYVTNADGSGQTRLTDSPGLDSDPAWSPDGNRIAFVSCDLPEPSPSEGLLHCDLSLMNADGSNRVPLTGEGEGNNYEPTWSPDGRHIAFSSNRDSEWGMLGPTDLNVEIYVMDADGSGQTRLTRHDAIDSGPAWLPAEPRTSGTPAAGATAGKPPSPTAPPDIATPPAPEGYVEQEPYAGDCRSRPSGATCIGYDDGYIWLVYNAAIMGWDIRGSWQGHTIQVALGEKADYYHVLRTAYVREEPK